MDSYPNRLREAIDRSPELAPSPEFVAALRRKLEAQAGASTRRSVRGWRVIALAASLLVAVSAGVAYRAYGFRTNALARAAVGDHVECALNMRLPRPGISLDEAALRFGPVYQVIQRVPRTEIRTPDGVAVVLDRHSCVYQGRRFGHVIMLYRGSTVSLMVTAADEGATARTARIDGMNVVAVRAGQESLFIAGESPLTDLNVLANSILGPLSRELGGR